MLQDEIAGSPEPVPFPVQEPVPFPITESPRDRKVALARSLGQPFSDHTVATWLDLGRRWLNGAADMERINSSWAIALADADVELLGRLLFEAEKVFAGGRFDTETAFAGQPTGSPPSGQEPIDG
jgi:hypothetical protein